MGKHPKIKVPAGRLEILFNVFSVLIIIIMVIYTFSVYQQLPDTIATHFNIKGEADGWGSKATLFIMPLISILLFISMYFLSKAPHLFNYTVVITEDNAPRIYPIARLMVAVLNFMIVLMFAFFFWESVQLANGYSFIGPWFAFVVLFAPLGVIVLFMIWMHRVE